MLCYATLRYAIVYYTIIYYYTLYYTILYYTILYYTILSTYVHNSMYYMFMYCVCIYIYIYIYISRPRGDRKFGGCFVLGCLGGNFGESVLKERRSERARLD